MFVLTQRKTIGPGDHFVTEVEAQALIGISPRSGHPFRQVWKDVRDAGRPEMRKGMYQEIEVTHDALSWPFRFYWLRREDSMKYALCVRYEDLENLCRALRIPTAAKLETDLGMFETGRILNPRSTPELTGFIQQLWHWFQDELDNHYRNAAYMPGNTNLCVDFKLPRLAFTEDGCQFVPGVRVLSIAKRVQEKLEHHRNAVIASPCMDQVEEALRESLCMPFADRNMTYVSPKEYAQYATGASYANYTQQAVFKILQWMLLADYDHYTHLGVVSLPPVRFEVESTQGGYETIAFDGLEHLRAGIVRKGGVGIRKNGGTLTFAILCEDALRDACPQGRTPLQHRMEEYEAFTGTLAGRPRGVRPLEAFVEALVLAVYKQWVDQGRTDLPALPQIEELPYVSCQRILAFLEEHPRVSIPRESVTLEDALRFQTSRNPYFAAEEELLRVAS